MVLWLNGNDTRAGGWGVGMVGVGVSEPTAALAEV